MTAADTSYNASVYIPQGAAELDVESGGIIRIKDGGVILDETNPVIHSLRTRLTIAQVNAGATLLVARAGYKYRMVGCKAIAYGGAAAAVTTVDVKGTQSTSVVKLVAYAQASLTQSTVLSAGGSGAAVLADGASYVPNDANTAITVAITGSSVTTATGIDIIFDYTIET